MTTLRGHLVCLDDLKVALVGQNHLEECLRQEPSDIAVHCLRGKDWSGLPAHCLTQCAFSLRLVQYGINVADFVLLQVEIRLALDHELGEVSVARRNDREEFIVAEGVGILGSLRFVHLDQELLQISK